MASRTRVPDICVVCAARALGRRCIRIGARYMRIHVCRCRAARACSCARAEGPVALAEEPEARAWAFHSCHPHRSLTIEPTGETRVCVGGIRPRAARRAQSFSWTLAHFAAIARRSGTQVCTPVFPRFATKLDPQSESLERILGCPAFYGMEKRIK
jgi:hypothetical protein